jgi:hypothetical protein
MGAFIQLKSATARIIDDAIGTQALSIHAR